MRIYLPSTLTNLAADVRDGYLRPPHGTAFAVTPGLTANYPEADIEELEYLAMQDAARASLRLIASQESSTELGEPRLALRVVVAADVSEVTVRDDLDRGVVRVAGPVPWNVVASVHVDGADASDAVAAAVTVIDAADMGDLDAEFVLGSAQDYELGWYAPNEISYLVAELGFDG
ncbi:hypothetical protein EH165_04245 [Nakamurella antarctica]|uniref:Uncharacterized protein n=1 Tax=Nakamurella antarctica TaxID=1902245 RepID=A0A3G8ZUU6_9ACTN|nr:hypothetical protein [Nakamurella antarctica]AZI57491.1 hypothetical protein EH165_04245 [Nakamurella antarctica]